ncbi:TniQ family protein [Paenibacillus sp. DR312]|uniref:TniQ family protein n=1 Tax=Paenibacillus sp. DR312 TaxID=2871175 RepID=UPI001C94F3D2|nr:TniQ family protein [Paenibacillus sp. DR312]QZN77680.1 TniQ family protein [Paenibacillus sp. DR312]
MYLIRLRPYQSESLLSYLNRTASVNKVSLIDLLKDVKNKNYTLRTDRIDLVDLYPNVVLDLNRLSKHTQLQHEEILKMTFYYPHFKFSHSEIDSHSRLMKGIVRKQPLYCPQCLLEHNYIRIFWKLSDMDICLEHKCYLISICMSCKSPINYYKLDYRNCCPCCSIFLGYSSSVAVNDDSLIAEQLWLFNQWSKLLNSCQANYTPEEVAQKIAFLIHEKYQDITLREACENVSIDYQELMQTARDTQTIKKSIHLSKVLNLISRLHVELEVFLSIQPTKEFISKYIKDKKDIDFNDSSCIAPWCSHHQRRGQLKETGTNYKKLKDGSVQKRYLFCPHCGCTYFFNASGKQVERDGFLKGYYELKENGFIGSGTPNLKIIEAYFLTRLSSQYEVLIDDNLLKRFINAIENYIGLNQIKEWKCWGSDDEYLMYRYHIDILRMKNSMRRKLKSRIDYDTKFAELVKVLEQFKLNNMSLNLNQIAKAVHLSTGTLRSWNRGHSAYQAAKKQQNVENLKQWIDDTYMIIDTVLSLNDDKFLRIKDVYNQIQIRQSYLLKVSPEVTHYISIEIKRHNAKLKKNQRAD